MKNAQQILTNGKRYPEINMLKVPKISNHKKLISTCTNNASYDPLCALVKP